MSLDPAILKSAAIGFLDAIAIELMFEGDSKSRPNMWVDARIARPRALNKIKQRPSPASKLRTEIGKGGAPIYRHSGLEKTPQLGEADLVCFAPLNLAELDQTLDEIMRISAVGAV